MLQALARTVEHDLGDLRFARELESAVARAGSSSSSNDPCGNARPGRCNRTLVIVCASLRGGNLAWRSLLKHVVRHNNADLALMLDKPPATVDSKATTLLHRHARFVWAVPSSWHKGFDWAPALDAMAIEATGSVTPWRKYAVMQPDNSIIGPFTLGNRTFRSTGAISYATRWRLRHELLGDGTTTNGVDATASVEGNGGHAEGGGASGGGLVRGGLAREYGRFVITRSDHLYACGHDLAALDPRFVWVPSGEDYGGVCDRHMVCSNADLRACLSLVDPLVAHPARYAWALRRLNMESFLKLRLAEQGALPRLRRFPRVMFTVGTAADRSLWSQPAAVAEPLFRSRVKYASEYVAAKWACGLCADGAQHGALPAPTAEIGATEVAARKGRMRQQQLLPPPPAAAAERYPCAGCPSGGSMRATGTCTAAPPAAVAAAKAAWLRVRLGVLLVLPLLGVLAIVRLLYASCRARGPRR